MAAEIRIWKYYDEEMRFYFNGGSDQPTFKDKIRLPLTKADGFPVFDMRVERENGVLEYKPGDFRITLSLLHTEKSFLNVGLLDFLVDGFANKYLIQVYFHNNCYYHGFFTSADIEQRLTYSQNELDAEIQVYGSLRELAESYSLPNQGTRIVDNDKTLEEYINYHFDNNDYLGHLHPATLYRQRIGDNSIVFSKVVQGYIYYSGLNLENIPRWQTYKQLCKGIGMNYKLKFQSPDNFLTNYPSFYLEDFFINDITAQDAVEVKVIEHNESFLYNAKKWVYLYTRQRVQNMPGIGNVTFAQGILFNNTRSISIDLPDFNGSVPDYDANQPSFRYNPDNSDEIVFADPAHLTEYEHEQKFSRNAEIAEIEFENYTNITNNAFYKAGALTYAACVVATDFNHKQIQEYTANVYGRYLLGNKKKKMLKVIFTGNENLELYRRVVLAETGGRTRDYFISAITDINLQERTAEIEATEL